MIHLYFGCNCFDLVFRTLRQEIENLRSDLNESEERELECQLHLANAVKVAEQASSERATYAAVAEKEQIASDHAKRRSMREQWEMGRMEESLKVGSLLFSIIC